MKIIDIFDNKEHYKGELVKSYGLTQFLIFSRQNNQLYTFVTKTLGGGGNVDILILDPKRKHQDLIKVGERRVPEDEHLSPSWNIYPCKLSKEEIMAKFRVYPSRVGFLP